MKKQLEIDNISIKKLSPVLTKEYEDLKNQV